MVLRFGTWFLRMHQRSIEFFGYCAITFLLFIHPSFLRKNFCDWRDSNSRTCLRRAPLFPTELQPQDTELSAPLKRYARTKNCVSAATEIILLVLCISLLTKMEPGVGFEPTWKLCFSGLQGRCRRQTGPTWHLERVIRIELTS